MSAVQETSRLHFGSGRLYGTGPDGTKLYFGQLQDLTMDLTTDLKTAFAEGNYPFASADGQRTIKLEGKHYMIDPNSLANSVGGTVGANTTGYVIDERGEISTVDSKQVYVLATTDPVDIVDVQVGVTINGVICPVHYDIVAAGDEVAGASCSFAIATGTGTLTFAAGDAVGTPVIVSYTYTLGTAAGSLITVEATYQNSQPTFQLVAIKRDRSQLADGSTGIEVWTFNAVRDGGIKSDWKEGDYNVYQRTFQAFADPMGDVFNVVMLNE
jgi:hypothetical protein